MKAIIEGKVMSTEVRTFEGKSTVNVSIYQEGSKVLDTVKMTVEEAAALNVKEGSVLKFNVNINAYKDNQQNARLSCKYIK